MGDKGPKPRFEDKARPNEKCKMHGKAGKGNIVGNETYSTKSGKVRKYVCRSCGTVFCDKTNTAFYDIRTKDENVLLALKLVIKGMSLRSIAEVLNVKLDTVLGWLSKASEHAEEVNKALLKELKVSKTYSKPGFEIRSIDSPKVIKYGLIDHNWTLKELLTFQYCATSTY